MSRYASACAAAGQTNVRLHLQLYVRTHVYLYIGIRITAVSCIRYYKTLTVNVPRTNTFWPVASVAAERGVYLKSGKVRRLVFSHMTTSLIPFKTKNLKVLGHHEYRNRFQIAIEAVVTRAPSACQWSLLTFSDELSNLAPKTSTLSARSSDNAFLRVHAHNHKPDEFYM